MPPHDRRTFLKGLAGALALGSLDSVRAHPTFSSGHPIHRHDYQKNAERVGFHSLGGKGPESEGGSPDNPLYGMVNETWVEGDLGFIAMQTTSEPTGNRGVAILDVSEYTRADSREELDDAEMSVLSYVGNESEAGTANDVKVSKDGKYMAYSMQAIGALYGEPASPSTAVQDAPGPTATGAEIYDISDPENPLYVGNVQGPNAGFHNCFVHQIGGDYYLFGVQGLAPGSAGVHIYRIDGVSGGITPVNFWGGDDVPVTDWGTDAVDFYCHDFYAHHDPKTGKPIGIISYWNNGGVILDLSDPTDITALGAGSMPRTHYAQPAPALIDGKRLFVGGQEHGGQGGDISGYVRLWDGDAIFEDGFTECEELATYTLYDNVSYDGYAFSPHNNDITKDGWITQSHYHAGVRFLKIQPPGESPTGEWHIAGRRVESTNDRPIRQEKSEDGGFVQTFETDSNGVFTSGFKNARLVEEGQAYYCGHVEVPEESKTDDIASPNFWSARTLNGVTFGGNQHTGLYAIAADPMPVGTRTAVEINIARSSSPAPTGQQTEIVYEVQTDETVRLRDRIPSSWGVADGDAVEVTDTGDGKRVEFVEPVEATDGDTATRTVVYDVGTGVGDAKVGPVQYTPMDDPSLGGKDWEPIADSLAPLGLSLV